MPNYSNRLFLTTLLVGCTLSSSLYAFGEPALTREPYIQLATPTSMIIRWRTDTPTDSRVEFGTSVGDLNTIVDDSTITTKHIITLTGLAPNTNYFYSVGTSTITIAGDDLDHHFTTHPIAGTAQPVRIWVIGDSGTGDDNARNVRDAYLDYTTHNPADVWITLGDNAYLLGIDLEYQSKFFNIYPSILRTTAVWPILGNHATFTDPDKQTGAFFENFTLPTAAQAGGVATGTEAYYSFDYANIHFVALNSFRTDLATDAPMLTWLVDDLADTDQPWIIAYWHHAPYSDGHNSDDIVHEEDMVLMRQNAGPILEAAGVDLVLSGHSHSYERSYLLDGHYGFSNTLDPSMILDAGDGNELGDGVYAKPSATLTPHEGTVYVVAGNAGQLTGDTPDHPAMSVSILELGSVIIDVHNTRLDAVFLNDAGIVRDRFTITKGPQPCRADLIVDGTLNFFDVSEFLRAFLAYELIADFTNDNTWDFFDISEFLAAFASGC